MYDTFCNDMVEKMSAFMGDDYQVTLNRVVKNNGISKDGLVIRKKDDTIAPTIYLNSFYEDYKNGKEMNSLMEEINEILVQEQKKDLPVLPENFWCFEEIRNKIIYRLVNYERNKACLKTMPHIRYLDLAITFHYLVECDDECWGTIRIQEEMIKRWDISIETLWTVAMENTKNMFPVQIRKMNDVICEILKKQDGFDDIGDIFPEQDIYILSNKKGFYGASALLYEDGLSHFANENESDFYILPSSIHEVILIPFQPNFSKEQLSQMVCEVNATEVPDEEILSSHVYFYSRAKNKVEM